MIMHAPALRWQLLEAPPTALLLGVRSFVPASAAECRCPNLGLRAQDSSFDSLSAPANSPTRQVQQKMCHGSLGLRVLAALPGNARICTGILITDKLMFHILRHCVMSFSNCVMIITTSQVILSSCRASMRRTTSQKPRVYRD